MRAVSDKFLRTLRGSHRAVFRARVCTAFQTGTNPTGTEIPFSSGDVVSSATADIRSTLNITTDQPWPRSVMDLLAPYGNEIFVERGITYGNGQKEWVGLGYYRINTPDQDNVPDGPVSVTCTDRMSTIIDAKLTRPQQFRSFVTRGDMVINLVNSVYPGAVIEWDDTVVRDTAIGRNIIVEQDRFGALMDLFTSLGKVGYFDYRGVLVIRTPPSTSGGASWTVDAGHNGVMVRMSRSLTREGVYNIAVVSGEAADSASPVVGTAADYGPESPTRVGGPFGPVPVFFTSPYVRTKAQAVTAAGELLKKSLGLPYQVSLGSIPNPALEPNDIIAISYPTKARSRTMQTEIHVLDEVTIPLSVDGEVSMRTRQQPVVLIGELP